jgi:5-methylcytosine-specific restriction protein B
VFVSVEIFDRMKSLLEKKKNIILTGAPGVGKTFAARRLSWAMMGERDDERVEFVQFHQSYTYEDFICGYKPSKNGGFELQAGVFYSFCKKAENDPERPYFFIIDEVNRGNVSKIFGELLMLIEEDKRGDKAYAVRLAYKPNELFNVPENLHIIGMMNTADRSLAMMDYALRRRFSFVSLEPGFDSEGFGALIADNEKMKRLVGAVKKLNEQISADASLGKGFVIGHSFFCGMLSPEEIIDYDIGPMLDEYWFDNPQKADEERAKLLDAIQ